MNVHLGNLKVGQWRNLTQQEMDEINAAVAGSSKTASIKGEPNARHLKSALNADSERPANKPASGSRTSRSQNERNPKNPRERSNRSRESTSKTNRGQTENNRGSGKEKVQNTRRGSSLTGKYNKK